MNERRLNDVLMRPLPGSRPRLFSPLVLLLPVILLSSLSWPAPAAAQNGEVAVERENFRAAPRGEILAELVGGTILSLGDARDRWREATVEAWIWAASVEAEVDGEHDLVVTASSGENLREAPNGTKLGRVRPGVRLEQLEARDRWLRVRRSGWMWQPSLRVVESEGQAPTETPGAGEGPPAENASAAATSGTTRSGKPGTVSPDSVAGAARAFASAGRAGAAVVATPAGRALARVSPGGSMEVLGREGEWTKVRIEGWTRTASLGSDSLQTTVLRDISLETLQEDPEGAAGRLVEWTLQYISLQHAERFRTDFVEGEAFMLARGPGEDTGFVYVAVAPERQAEVENLPPLQRVRVLGRVRTARSRLTGAPILELLEIRPVR